MYMGVVSEARSAYTEQRRTPSPQNNGAITYEEPCRVCHALLAVLLQHELADVDAQPILHDVFSSWVEPFAIAKDVLKALARPIVSRSGVVIVVIVIRCAVPW